MRAVLAGVLACALLGVGAGAEEIAKPIDVTVGPVTLRVVETESGEKELRHGTRVLVKEFSINEGLAAKFKDGKATLRFENVGGGLEAKGGPLSGFAIAGTNQVFAWATASIEGDKVVVSNPAVPQPVAVRYGWSDFPVVNLFSKQGLPATPFRTDDWKMETKPEPKEPKK